MKSKIFNIKFILLYMLILSFFFGRFNFQLLFAIKPYMIVSVFCFIYLLLTRQFKILKLSKYEIIFLIFTLFVFFTSLFSNNILDSVRYICGFIFIFFIYIIIKSFLLTFEKKEIKKAIIKIGFIYAIISLLYYLKAFNNIDSIKNGAYYYGILIDRNISRLISMASIDPNISAMYFSFFYYYYLSYFGNIKCKIGTALYLILIILTLSRGAIISLVATTFLYILITIKKNKEKASKIIFLLFILICIGCYVGIKYGLFEIIINRFTSNDGGSGRLDLWKSAITTFFKHPLIGIGINNTLNYNIQHYNLNHYIHNTYLEVLSELGFFGMIIYVCFIISIFC